MDIERRRLLCILQKGAIEIRRLAHEQVEEHDRAPINSRQIEELADILEIIPFYIAKWSPEFMGDLRQQLDSYQRNFKGYYDLLGITTEDVPEDFGGRF